MADEKKEEKTYEVKDKRRVNPDGTLKEDLEAEKTAQQPEEQETETVGSVNEEKTETPSEAHEEQGKGTAAEMPPPNVFETLQFVTTLLAEQAWQFMGLHLPPGSKEPVTDLAQAKVAIDTVVFIADKLHPHLSEEDRKVIRGIISDLQLNFVQRGS